MNNEKIFDLVCEVVSRVLEIPISSISRSTNLTSLGANDKRRLLILEALKSHGVPMPSWEELRDQLKQDSVQGLCNYAYCMLRRASSAQEKVWEKPTSKKPSPIACLG